MSCHNDANRLLVMMGYDNDDRCAVCWVGNFITQ